MTTTVLNNVTLAAQPRPSLEELVDRLMAALFREKPEMAAIEITSPQSVTQTIHDGRREISTARWPSSLARTRRRLRQRRFAGPTPSG